MEREQFSYGGQAVLEGVMMRGQRQASVAVRQADGQIAFKHISLQNRQRPSWMRLPIVRGIVGLVDAFAIGKQALDFSASVAVGEEEDELPQVLQTLVFIVALAIGIGLFVIVPSLIANMAGQMGVPVLVREMIEGAINLSMVVAYIYAISQLRDIQRVFGYHGAEHKVINAYEAGAPLNVESVRGFSRIHPRCGTSFLIIAALLGFVIFLSVSGLPLWQRVASRIVLIPVVATVAFEFMRLTASYYQHSWVQRLMQPILSTQYLTTREPDDAMIETAIAALVPVLAADGIVSPVVDDSQALAPVT